MTKHDHNLPPRDIDQMLRQHILARAKAISETLLIRLTTARDDLDEGHDLAALGGLDGIEREITNLRSFLLLLSWQGISSFTTQPIPHKETI